jgi:hypothetical protein
MFCAKILAISPAPAPLARRTGFREEPIFR